MHAHTYLTKNRMMPAIKLIILAGTLFVGCDLAGAKQMEEDDGNTRLMVRLMTECGRKEDVAVCLKMRAFTFLDKLSRMGEPVAITEYLSLVKNPAAASTGQSEANRIDRERGLTEAELEAVLPRSLDEKSAKLDEMLLDKVSSLLGQRTIRLNIPGSVFEGRGSGGGGGGTKGGKKGMGGMMMMAAMMMGMMLKMALAKIALIAGKALIVGKIALVLSLIMALKKWASSGHHHSEVVFTSSDHGGHRRSNMDDAFVDYAHGLAYSAQKPDVILM